MVLEDWQAEAAPWAARAKPLRIDAPDRVPDGSHLPLELPLFQVVPVEPGFPRPSRAGLGFWTAAGRPDPVSRSSLSFSV